MEQLCRYITRPALANERVQRNTAGQMALELQTPWRNGTMHLMLLPPEFMKWSRRNRCFVRPSAVRPALPYDRLLCADQLMALNVRRGSSARQGRAGTASWGVCPSRRERAMEWRGRPERSQNHPVEPDSIDTR